MSVDESLVVPDTSLTLNEGAIATWQPISSTYYMQLLSQACEHFGIDMDTPFKICLEKSLFLMVHRNDYL